MPIAQPVECNKPGALHQPSHPAQCPLVIAPYLAILYVIPAQAGIYTIYKHGFPIQALGNDDKWKVGLRNESSTASEKQALLKSPSHKLMSEWFLWSFRLWLSERITSSVIREFHRRHRNQE